MAGLPQIIEIVPATEPVSARIRVPGSKSITNRALILAALAEGKTTITGALWSEDTQVMVDCLFRMGYRIEVKAEPGEEANRTLEVTGRGGEGVPNGGTAEKPLELFVGNAGTAARFLSALVCLGHGAYRLSGVPRMRERPQSELFSALRELGYQVDAPGEKLPAVIYGSGPKSARCVVSVRESSQFASALLLAQRAGGWQVDVAGENAEEEGAYVAMTREMARLFPERGGIFNVEPDASSASYFVAANFILSQVERSRGSEVCVGGVPETDWQVDNRFGRFLPLPGEVSRARDLGDSILTAMVVAPFSRERVRFTDLGRLRVQECDRVRAIREGLEGCGARVDENGDVLTVWPSADALHGAEVETYADHRIAMCFAVLGLVVPGIKIRNPACVKKTFPNFFQKLALPMPEGLGRVIRHGRQALRARDLFAD